HTSVGFAVVGAVVGEYLGSAAGLGYIIQQAEGVFDVAGVFAGMVVLTAFVLFIDWLVTLAERRLLVWRPGAAQTRMSSGGQKSLALLEMSPTSTTIFAHAVDPSSFRVGKIAIELRMRRDHIRRFCPPYGTSREFAGLRRKP